MIDAQIRRISSHNHAQLDQIAKLHIAEIRGGFLSSLGEQVLRDFYYTIAQSDGSFIIAAVSDRQQVLGFLAGGIGTHSLYREHLKYRQPLSIIRLAFTLALPKRLRKIIETLRYTEQRNDSYPRAEILNFCVDSRAQRAGLGRRLMASAEAEFADKGIDCIKIITGQTQTKAQNFYRKLGALYVKDFELHAGTKSTMFLWHITKSEVV